MSDVEFPTSIEHGAMEILLQNIRNLFPIFMPLPRFDDCLNVIERLANIDAVASVRHLSWFYNPIVVKALLLSLSVSI